MSFFILSFTEILKEIKKVDEELKQKQYQVQNLRTFQVLFRLFVFQSVASVLNETASLRDHYYLSLMCGIENGQSQVSKCLLQSCILEVHHGDHCSRCVQFTCFSNF